MSPNDAFDHAVTLMTAGDQPGAIAAFRHTLSLAPRLFEAHVNLGLLLSRATGMRSNTAAPLDDLRTGGSVALDAGPEASVQAEVHYRCALAIAPSRLEAYVHLGALLAAQKRFDEAEMLYRTALSIDAHSLAALSNLGVLLACTGREEEAAACYRAALAISPTYDNAQFNLAYLLLKRGQFAQGWQAFEHRPWYARLDACFHFPRWQGENLHGKSLLIGIEAGHGDMIQFCRYAALAKQAGTRRIGIVCHPGLTRLLRSMPSIDSVFGIDQPLPADGWDYWTPPLSMPYHFATRLDSIPACLPYLAAEPPHIAAMAAILATLPGSDARQSHLASRRGILRVGLVWQGNPNFENDADRSLPSLDVLAPLCAARNVCFFSLQKGAGALAASTRAQRREHAPCPAEASSTPAPERIAKEKATAGATSSPVSSFPGIVDLAPYIHDFADTAAFIAQLDLIITVDTAVAHLAGALGKPCWVLLPAFKPDWRWLTDREDSPWYPGCMRLFRQSIPGDWSDPLTRIADALSAFRR